MKICIDMRPALSRPTGVGTYILNLVESLAKGDSENEYFLFSSSWKERYPAISYGENFHLHDVRIPVRLLNFCWNRLSFPSVEAFLGNSVSIVHSPSPLLIPSSKARKITTIYDLHFFLYPEHSIREVRSDYPVLVKDHSERSDAIITTSEHTKELLIEKLHLQSGKIHCIYPGVDPFFLVEPSTPEIDVIRAKYAESKPYFLFVGAREPRKNLSILIQAFQRMKGDFHLVLVGPEGWGGEEWKKVVTNRVRIVNYLPKNDLRSLYRGAVALVMPSLEEGFGFPLLEAMACGTPVVASRIPVFQEVAGDAYLSFSPKNEEELFLGLNEVAENSELRSRLIARGTIQTAKYAWSQTAEKTLDLYRSLHS